jgi:Fic family protein
MKVEAVFKPNFTITNKINNALLEIERARGFLEAANLKEEWVRAMQSEALILEAHHSTHIEGTQLTLPEARRILAGELVDEAQTDDRQELLNYRAAIELVSERIVGSPDITEELVKEIHAVLVRDVRGGTLEPGSYRTVQNAVVNSETEEVIYMPPPPEEVPPLMADFVDWLNAETDISPVLIAGIAHFRFVDIHPFVDGNGRTTRVLCTHILNRGGYDFKRLFSLSEYYDRGRQAYYEAIQSVRGDKEDLTGWLEYFTEGLRSQLMEVREKGLGSIKSEVLKERIKALDLNDRQRKALDYLLTNRRIDNTTYQAVCGTIRRTASRDLLHLVEVGLLEKHGERKGTFYTLKF